MVYPIEARHIVLTHQEAATLLRRPLAEITGPDGPPRHQIGGVTLADALAWEANTRRRDDAPAPAPPPDADDVDHGDIL